MTIYLIFELFIFTEKIIVLISPTTFSCIQLPPPFFLIKQRSSRNKMSTVSYIHWKVALGGKVQNILHMNIALGMTATLNS